MRRSFLFALSLMIASGLAAQSVRKEFKSLGWAGNPVFEGWYADPEGMVWGDTFWIFPTLSEYFGEARKPSKLSPLQKELQKHI